LGVTGAELILLGVVAAIVLALLAVFHKELELTSVDPTHASTTGLSPDLLRYGLLLLTALAVVAGIQSVGVVLTAALLVTPSATAALLTDRLPRMLVVAALIAVAASVIGLYASYYLDVASGPAIVLACTAFFALAWGWRARRPRARRPSAAS